MARFEVISIVGPTAVGKTALALRIAEQIPAEIVSLDAFQIYRGMDIGTAKASNAERQLVPHHLIDVVDIDYPTTVAHFTQWANDAIAEITAAGKTAICVGGSGLYVQSVLEILTLQPTDVEVRNKYLELERSIGAVELHALLQKVDPAAAAHIEVADSRRVVRALEVNELTGESFLAQLKPNPARYHDLRIGLELPRPELNVRIANRVEQMLEAGWLDEVRLLVEAGLLETPTAQKAIGYRELAQVLTGALDIQDAKAAIVQATTRFGKRQMTWFRRDTKITWQDPQKVELPFLS